MVQYPRPQGPVGGKGHGLDVVHAGFLLLWLKCILHGGEELCRRETNPYAAGGAACSALDPALQDHPQII